MATAQDILDTIQRHAWAARYAQYRSLYAAKTGLTGSDLDRWLTGADHGAAGYGLFRNWMVDSHEAAGHEWGAKYLSANPFPL